MEKLLTYALLNDKLVHVSNVKNGLECGCLCPKCLSNLIAKNNPSNKKISHFAHFKDKACKGAYETALHLLAKEVLFEQKRILLPDFHFDYQARNPESLYTEGSVIEFEEIYIERIVKTSDSVFVPDVIGSKKGREIYIEFAVTHFVDIVKIEKIKKLSTPAIEIFIGNQVLDKELLSEFFMSRSFEKYWLFNPKQDELYRMSLALIENRQQENANLKRVKLKRYSNTPGIRVLQVGEDGWIENCPKKSVALLSMKNSAFYTHQVLKRIIDGEFWNGKIYGYENQGKYIFLQNQKIYVYPPSKSNEIESVGNKSSNLFFAGLHSILEVLENREFGDCPKCQYSKDNFEINKDAYEICAHP